jgi:CHAT domain-containing protein
MAGARSLLMSLWKVPGESTPMLTEALYTNLWEKQAWATIRDNPYG